VTEFGSDAGPVVPRPSTALPTTGGALDFTDALTGIPGDRLSGTLLVAGDPGGSFHFRAGAVVEVSSPGAPGVETLLLRSGRVGESDWAAALRAGIADHSAGAELVAKGLVGTAELQLVCLMAALDGALAVGVGRIDGFTLDHDSPAHRLEAPEGIDPEWLLQETQRRIGVLGSLGPAASPFRGRPRRTFAGDALLDGSAAGDRREILLRVNGRRSPRDIAFLLGRSLYAVAVEMSRLHGDGLVEVVRETGGDLDGPSAPAESGAPDSPGIPLQPSTPGGPGGLPYRRRGMSRISDILPLRPVTDHRRSPTTSTRHLKHPTPGEQC